MGYDHILELIIWGQAGSSSFDRDHLVRELAGDLPNFLRFAYSQKLIGEVERLPNLASEVLMPFSDAVARSADWTRKVFRVLTPNSVILKGRSVQPYYPPTLASRFGSDVDVWVPTFGELKVLEKNLQDIGLNPSSGYGVTFCSKSKRVRHLVARSAPAQARPGFRGVEIHVRSYPVVPGGYLEADWFADHRTERTIDEMSVGVLKSAALGFLVIADRADRSKRVALRDLIDIECISETLSEEEKVFIVSNLASHGLLNAIDRYRARYSDLRGHRAPSSVNYMLQGHSGQTVRSISHVQAWTTGARFGLDRVLDKLHERRSAALHVANNHPALLRQLARMGLVMYVERNDDYDLDKLLLAPAAEIRKRMKLRPVES